MLVEVFGPLLRETREQFVHICDVQEETIPPHAALVALTKASLPYPPFSRIRGAAAAAKYNLYDTLLYKTFTGITDL